MEKLSMKDNLKEQVYRKLKQDILLCTLKPGDRLFDKDLAAQLQISRTPVREALLLLEKERLVVSESRSGFAVRRISIEEIRQFFEIRERLLDYAAELLIDNATVEDIELMEESATLSEQCHAKGHHEEYVLTCADFHKALRDATHCEIYIRIMENLNDIMTLFRSMTVSVPGSVDMSIREHRNIISAVKNRDQEAVKEALFRHLDGPRANMQLLASFM